MPFPASATFPSTASYPQNVSFPTFLSPTILDIDFSTLPDSAALASVGDQLGTTGLYRTRTAQGNTGTPNGQISSGKLLMGISAVNLLEFAPARACQSVTVDAYFTQGAGWPTSKVTYSVTASHDAFLGNFIFVEFGSYVFGNRMTITSGVYKTSEVDVTVYDGLTYDPTALHRLRCVVAPGLYPNLVVTAELRNIDTNTVVSSHSININRDEFRQLGVAGLRGANINGTTDQARYDRLVITTQDGAGFNINTLFPAGTIKVMTVGDSNRNFGYYSGGIFQPAASGNAVAAYRSALATATGKTVYICNPSTQGLWAADYLAATELGDYVLSKLTQVDYVDVAITSNAAWTTRQPATYISSVLGPLAQTWAAASGGKFVLVQYPPAIDSTNPAIPAVMNGTSNPYLVAQNADMPGIVSGNVKIGLATVFSDSQTNAASWLGDGLHFSPTGGPQIASRWAAGIQAAFSL